jgi:8-oxo-dGTP diphosphatase
MTIDVAQTVDVAVAVIHREDGMVLFAERPAGKACAGEWEFPGGKIEAGESALDALVREIDEELAMHVTRARPWVTLQHAYAHAHVRLHFFIVTGWTGEPHGREGQQLVWQDLHNMTVGPLLSANAPVIRALQLPDIYAISYADKMGTGRFLDRLRAALDRGLKLIQLRETTLPSRQFEVLARNVLDITRGKAEVMVNSAMPWQDPASFGGLHLTSSDLMRLDKRPGFKRVAASCHNSAELQQAARLGLDFVVLSPVQQTLSHPGSTALGVDGMRQLIRNYPLPVYALGGMHNRHLAAMQAHGAHGIAMMRAAWHQT